MARRATVASPEMTDAAKDVEEIVQHVESAATGAATVLAEETRQAAEAAETAITPVISAVTKSSAQASSRLEDATVKFNQGVTHTMKTAEEVLAFSQGNVEAFIKSGQIWTAGLQDLSKQFATSAQSSYEEAVAAFKALTTVKSLKEAVDLQVGLARSVLEKGVSESNKYTDASFKLAEQAIAPISGRVTLAVEKFSKTA